MNKKIENFQIHPSHKKPGHRRVSSYSKPSEKPTRSSSKTKKKTDKKTPLKKKVEKTKKGHRRTVSDTASLNPLKGAQKKKAPKIFENQIFVDIYDEKGNHDRILETFESLEIYEEKLGDNNKLTFLNKSDISTRKFIQPELSYRSIEATSDNIKSDLLKKIQKIIKRPKLDSKDSTGAVNVSSRKLKNSSKFFFH